jgi:hypothetical protein
LKRDEDVDGAAVILARRDITAGEEVTISYLDGVEEMTVGERRVALADYGFVCRCRRCLEEGEGASF